MTTRRDLIKIAAGAGLAALSTKPLDTAAAGTPASELEGLIAARDQVRKLLYLDDETGLRMMAGAQYMLDDVIMKLCPHDPTTYSVEPAPEIEGVRSVDWVTCPVCRATTIRDRQGTEAA